MKRSFIREILEHTNSDAISFAGGLPDSRLFPNLALKESANIVLQNQASLQYTHSTGEKALKEKIAKQYTNDGFPTKSDEIMITSGSQQALDIITRYYQGESITIESPSYLGAINLFRLNNLKMDSVRLGADGIDISQFKEKMTQTALCYLIPDFQNPTGLTYSHSRRVEVADVISKTNGLLIEDSPYSKLYFEEEMPSISSYIPNNSFHLGSFSKSLAPALRIGWIRANKKLLQPLIAYKEAMDLHTNGLAQQILNHYLEESRSYANHLELLRDSYEKKMHCFSMMLNKYLPTFSYVKPKGGMFIYGRFDEIDTSYLLKKCLAEGVLFVPGIEFYIDEKVNNEIRFNFTNASKDEVEQGLMTIGDIIENKLLCTKKH